MITRARIAELRKTWPQDMQSAELDEVLDAAESALELQEDMARIDYRNRCVEDMLNRATDDTRAIREIVTKWMFAK